jgi:hypothetical protein
MEGEKSMRKESTGRLLLTLLTGFVMIVGVFGAAVNTSFIETADTPFSSVADSEQDVKTREMGDAPISALSEDFSTTFADSNVEGTEQPAMIPVVDEHIKETKKDDYSQATSQPEATGTRATGIDADGPYGTPSMPFIEGDSVTFSATTIPAGEEANHYWRWDVDGDDVWDMDEFGGTMGVTDYTHDFTDNHIGQAKVQAWDGVSMNTISGDGDIWDGAGITWYLWRIL